MNYFRGLLLIAILSGCSTTQKPPSHTWKELQISSLILERKDPKEIDVYKFSKRAVAATFGVKDEYLCCPVYTWKISGDLLLITDFDKSPVEKLRLIEIGKNEVLVQNASGAQVIYKIKKQQK